MTDGVSCQVISGVKVCITDPERTVVDLFRWRNRIGVETAVEGLVHLAAQGDLCADRLFGLAERHRMARVIGTHWLAVRESVLRQDSPHIRASASAASRGTSQTEHATENDDVRTPRP